jgi:hypothetical protein
MRVEVNLSIDLAWGILAHYAATPPAVPVPVLNLSVEIPMPQAWPAGLATNKVQRTSSVRHRGQEIILMYHDCGPCLLHLTLPLTANVLLPTIILFSKRKIVFTSSTVRMNGKPVGCTGATIPMLTCGDPASTATAFPISSFTNTVRVGMTTGDLAAGWSNIFVSMVIDAVFHRIKLRKGPPDPLQGSFLDVAAMEVYKKFVKELTDLKSIFKKALASASGFATSLMTDYPTFKLSVGVPWLRASVQVDAPEDHWSIKLTGHAIGQKKSLESKGARDRTPGESSKEAWQEL